MKEQSAFSAVFYPLLASFAGAVTALSFRAFRDMTKAEIFMTLFVGASFAFFMGPWITTMVFGNGPINLRLQGALYYLLASGSHIFIPLVWRKLTLFVGTKDEIP